MAASGGGSRGSLRNRAAGVAILGLVGLGIYLFNDWKGPGIGGNSTGTGQTADSSTSPHADPTAEELSDTSVNLGNATSLTNTSATGQGQQELVYVLIHGAGYRLPAEPVGDIETLTGTVSSHFREATLEEVIAAARATTGSANGIHVDVLRHTTATAGARSELLKQLQDAGFRQSQILLRDEKFYE